MRTVAARHIGRDGGVATRIETAALEPFGIGCVQQVIARGLETERGARREIGERGIAAEIGRRGDNDCAAAELRRKPAQFGLPQDIRCALVMRVAPADRQRKHLAYIVGEIAEHGPCAGIDISGRIGIETGQPEQRTCGTENDVELRDGRWRRDNKNRPVR